LEKTKKPSNAERARRQQFFNRAVIVATVIVIVIVTAYALSRPTSVELPDYLNRCIPETGTLAYSSSFQLQILINGANYTIPGGIGILGKSCIRPIHTFVSKTGPVTLYVDSDVNRTYTLKDFFLLWGSTYGLTYATFSRDELFTYRADNTHLITMRIVNANETREDASFGDYPLPTRGNTSTNPLILISYG